MAEALVLVPGMLCTRDLWADVPLPTGTAVEAAAIAGSTLEEAVSQVLERAPARFALAGLALGGTVALAVARTAPGRVTRLALLSTNPRPPRPDQRASWDEAVARIDDGASARDEQRRLLPLLLGPVAASERSGLGRPALERRILAMADDVGTEGLLRQLAVQGDRVDERPFLAALDVPVLVVAAADDALCTVAQQEELASGTRGAVLEVLGSTGHLSPMERSAQVGALLSAWMVR